MAAPPSELRYWSSTKKLGMGPDHEYIKLIEYLLENYEPIIY